MKKRSLFTGILALTLIAAVSPAPSTQADTVSDGAGTVAQVGGGSAIAVLLNGKQVSLSVSPQLVGSTLMVPFRELAEALGVKVDWNEPESAITADKGEQTIRLKIGDKNAERGGKPVVLEEAPPLINGKALVPLRFFSESFDFNVYWDGLNRTVSIVDADKSLPTVGSQEHMEALMKEAAELNGGINGGFIAGGIRVMATDQMAVQESAPVAKSAASSSAPAAAAPAAPQAKADYSATNVQVEGVDEADVIKTDGKYIYMVNRNRILVAQAVPAEAMNVVGTVTFEDKNFTPQEMYVDDKHLVVIGHTFYPSPKPEPAEAEPVPMGSELPASSGDSPSASAGSPAVVEKLPIKVVPRDVMIWPGPSRNTTKAIVYDLTDRSRINKLREVELEGSYISSRKIGSSLYIVTNKSMNSYVLMRTGATPEEKRNAASLPSYRDSAAGPDFIQIGYEDIRYFPKSAQPNYMLVGGLNLDQTDGKMQVSSYLGSGQKIYASEHHLYVTVTEYEPLPKEPAAEASPDASSGTEKRVMPIMPVTRDVNSVIYKFGMDNGSVTYKGRGKVPGMPLNQYAMDEQDGYFRIATTKGDMWRNDEFTSKNNIYVLNDSMNIAGKIEDLAPGERIYSVRFMGSRAYMVTYKKTDPLFVLDLKDPQAPKLLGQLKIPGYSDYLHPYDENHLIGFGKDAVEVPNKGVNGALPDTTAFYQGMKLALFDVSDVEHPKEMFKETIGDRGTDSELLHNPKALLFSKEKNLLAFPVTVAEVKNKESLSGPEAASAYGEFVFQGAYVYGLDLAKGFQLRGKISHLTGEDMQKAGRQWYNSERNINRLLYIGDTLYTSSPGWLKANDLAALKETGSLELPPWTPQSK